MTSEDRTNDVQVVENVKMQVKRSRLMPARAWVGPRAPSHIIWLHHVERRGLRIGKTFLGGSGVFFFPHVRIGFAGEETVQRTDRACSHGEQVLLLASPAATPNNPTTPAPPAASASPCTEGRQEVEGGRSYANSSTLFWMKLLRCIRFRESHGAKSSQMGFFAISILGGKHPDLSCG